MDMYHSNQVVLQTFVSTDPARAKKIVKRLVSYRELYVSCACACNALDCAFVSDTKKSLDIEQNDDCNGDLMKTINIHSHKCESFSWQSN